MPLLDRVLVQRVKAEAKTATGIFLPEAAVKELNEAKVLAVGPGGFNKDGQRIEMSVKPGDKVLIPQVCVPVANRGTNVAFWLTWNDFSRTAVWRQPH
jgi:co-chaperonin GroES (HSP10)